MIKLWRVTAELFWDASRIDFVDVKANTERKAKIFAEEAFQIKHPTVGKMIRIQKVERIDK